MVKTIQKCFALELHPLKMFLVYIVLLIGGCILLILANTLPSEKVREHIASSVDLFVEQGNYPYMAVNEIPYALDNWTEAVLLNFYYTSDSDKPIYSALVSTEYRPENSTGVERLETLVNDTYWEKSDFLLRRSSYWLGYSIVLRPLLFFFEYQTCRILINVIAYAMLIALTVLIEKKLSTYVAVGFGTLMVLFQYYSLSAQYTLGIFCVFIAFITIIYLLYNNERKRIDYLYLMFIVGIATAYFEWFSIPLITWGLPVVLILFLEREKNNKCPFFTYFNCVFQCGMGWCLGYGLMILGKTLVSMMVIGSDSWQYFAERLTADSSVVLSSADFLKALLNLLHCIVPFIFIQGYRMQALILLMLLALCILVIGIYKKEREFNLILLIVAFAPIVWYSIFKGHVTHVGIEFRTFMISYFAVWMILKAPYDSLRGKYDKQSKRKKLYN